MRNLLFRPEGNVFKIRILVSLMLFLFAFTTYASSCVDNFKWVIENQVNTTYDEKLMDWVVKNRMFAHELKGFKHKIKSQNFGPDAISEMLDQVSVMVKKNHPAMEEFACYLKTKNIKISHEAAREVRVTLHYMLALEVLTKSMSENKIYMGIVKDYLMKKRSTLLVSKKGEKLKIKEIVGKSKALKITLLDSAFDEYLEFRDRTDFTNSDLLKKNVGLLANIKWAAKTDKKSGYVANYLVGNNFLTSASYLPTGLVEEIWLDHNDLVRQEFKPGWTKLYQVWNLAFILGNMKDLYLFLPKLLIPSVLSADENAYLMTRTMALWTTINFALIHDVNLFKYGKMLPQLKVDSDVVKALGETNMKYAREALK